MKVRSATLITSLGLILLCACNGKTDCGIADSVEEIRQITSGTTHYHFYRRTSGLSDKTRFIEVYDQPPAIDACGNADRTPLAAAVLESDRGKPVRVVYTEGRLDVEYAAGTADTSNAMPDIRIATHPVP